MLVTSTSVAEEDLPRGSGRVLDGMCITAQVQHVSQQRHQAEQLLREEVCHLLKIFKVNFKAFKAVFYSARCSN